MVELEGSTRELGVSGGGGGGGVTKAVLNVSRQ